MVFWEGGMDKKELSGQSRQEIRKVVDSFFTLIGNGKYKDVLPLFSPDCKTHNPYVAGGMPALVDAMIAAAQQMGGQVSEPEFKVMHTLIDGDKAAVHTNLIYSRANPGKGGLRQVHIFRFESRKIVEYWDITQQIMESMPNAAGAF